MAKEQIRSELADILEVEEETLTDDTVLADLETWDSVAVLSLIALIGEKTDKHLHADDIAKAKKVGDLYGFFA